MWPGNLSPDNSDLGSSDLLLRTVDESNLLSEVEATIMINMSSLLKHHSIVPCSLCIRNTLDLDQARAWGGVALATLIAQMATPIFTINQLMPSNSIINCSLHAMFQSLFLVPWF